MKLGNILILGLGAFFLFNSFKSKSTPPPDGPFDPDKPNDDPIQYGAKWVTYTNIMVSKVQFVPLYVKWPYTDTRIFGSQSSAALNASQFLEAVQIKTGVEVKIYEEKLSEGRKICRITDFVETVLTPEQVAEWSEAPHKYLVNYLLSYGVPAQLSALPAKTPFNLWVLKENLTDIGIYPAVELSGVNRSI